MARDIFPDLVSALREFSPDFIALSNASNALIVTVTPELSRPMFNSQNGRACKVGGVKRAVTRSAVAASILATAIVSHAQVRTAQVTVDGKAVQLLPSDPVFVVGAGNVTSYFTTFNGNTGTPLVDTARGGVVSGELRPRAGSAGLYEGGYAQATPLVIFDYGSYVVSIPTTDSDGNGIPDFLQYDRPGTFSATGSGLSAFVGTFSITINFSRTARSASGTYSAVTVNASNQTNTVSGAYSLLSYQGSLSYTRGATNTMTISVTGLFQGGVLLTGNTTYTTINTDQLSYAAFTIRDPSGITYQAKAGTMTRSGNVYRGTLSLVDGLPQTSWADFTDYVFAVTDTNDSNGDGIPDFTDPTAVIPTITTQPKSLSAIVGQAVTLTVVATGNAAYQWSKNGVPIPGATNASLSFTSVQLLDAGTYLVTATNTAGTVTSAAAVLSISPAPARPVFTIQPISLTVANGSTLVLSADATGVPTPTFQWSKNGISIVGATSRNLVVSPATSTTGGTYLCTATNSTGTTASSPATIVVSDSKDVGRLVNLSIRTNAGPAEQTLIVGFTVGGGGTLGGKPLLIRGGGPALSQFGLTGVLQDPLLTLYSGSIVYGFNDDWGGDPQVKQQSSQLGAFAFASDGSKDSAFYSANIPAGGYTAQITGVGGTSGVALAEIYDATPSGSFATTTPRLINASARTQVGTDAGILIAGFVVGGGTAKTLLVRAVGPTLAAFSVPGVLVDPKLELYAGSALLTSNDDWSGDSSISAIATSVGAFPLSNTSKDAALLVTLPPGSYSAQVSGAGRSTGAALVELYEVPNPPAPAINLSDGLIGYYTFNGNAADQSGAGNNATPAGNTQYVSFGLSGGALRITGDNALFYSGGGHVLLPTLGSYLNDGFTISLWVKDEVIGTDPVGQEDYVSFGILDQPRFGIGLTNNPGQATVDYYMDTGLGGAAHLDSVLFSHSLGDRAAWRHLVIVYSPGRFAGFYNGAKVSEKAITFTGNPLSRAALGRHWWSGGSGSSARMSVSYDNVRIYRRALSDSDVQALYSGEVGTTP